MKIATLLVVSLLCASCGDPKTEVAPVVITPSQAHEMTTDKLWTMLQLVDALGAIDYEDGKEKPKTETREAKRVIVAELLKRELGR